MNNFGDNHPCAGKDCRDCETCIFDRDLFESGITPNEKAKIEDNKVNRNMCNKKVCNGCKNLSKDTSTCVSGHFDAACDAVSYNAFGVSRARRIEFSARYGDDIIRPNWCPLKEEQLALPSQTTATSSTPSTSSNVPAYTSYSDRRDKMKALRKHIEWEDIEEGKTYVIPKILTQSRKIVKVITKTDMSCVCHEISEITGAEFSYNCMVYPSDLDAVFINEIHKF